MAISLCECDSFAAKGNATAQFIQTLTFIAAVGSGLMAGLYFAFSNSVMSGLGRLPVPQGIAGMNHINAVIQNWAFLGWGPVDLDPMALGTAQICKEKTAGRAGCPSKVFDAADQSRFSVLQM